MGTYTMKEKKKEKKELLEEQDVSTSNELL